MRFSISAETSLFARAARVFSRPFFGSEITSEAASLGQLLSSSFVSADCALHYSSLVFAAEIFAIDCAAEDLPIVTNAHCTNVSRSVEPVLR